MKRLAKFTLCLTLLALGALALAPQRGMTDDDYLVILGTRHLDAYDAEYHIGLVSEDDSDETATENTERLNSALANMWDDGNFDFAHGASGPVDRPIVFRGRNYFFKGEIVGANRNGSGKLIGLPGGYAAGSNESGSGQEGGKWTRFTRIDPASDGRAILRLRGAGINVEGIQFNGHPLPGNIQSGEAPRNQYGILLEGNTFASPGKHRFQKVSITGCDKAIAFIDGYWDESDVFHENTPLGQHADESTWDDIIVTGCKTAVWSNNENAVWHRFRNLSVGQTGSAITGAGFISSPENPIVVFDCEAGGLWDVQNLYLGPHNMIVLRVKGWSPNSGPRFDIKNLCRDGGGTAGSQLFRLFEYVGSGDASFQKWQVRISGNIADDVDFNADTATELRDSLVYDPAELAKFTGTGTNRSPSANILFDISNLPVMTGVGGTLTGFTHAGFDGSSLDGYTWEQVGNWWRLVQ